MHRRLALIFAFGLVSTPATAQDEMCAKYTLDDLREDMDRIDTAVRKPSLPEASHLSGQLHAELRCLNELAPRQDLQRFAQQRAVLAFFDQDEEQVRLWGLAARYLDAGQDWPDYGPPVLGAAIEELENVDLAGPEGAQLLHPKGSAVFLNGAVLTEPLARIEIPNLIQLADKTGKVSEAWWQDGAAFREQILGGTGEAPKWASKVTSGAVLAGVATPEAPPLGDDPTVESIGALIAQLGEGGTLEVVPESEWMFECPWAGQDLEVSARMMSLYVNDVRYDVAGRKDRRAFVDVLDSCYESRARRRYRAWRGARRVTNVMVFFSWAIVPIPIAVISGTAAAGLRRGTVNALMRPPE